MNDIEEEPIYPGRKMHENTVEERLAYFAKIQAEMWAKLRSDPEAYAAFMRRNFKKRAINVKKLGL